MPRCGPPSSVRTVHTVFSSLYVAPFPNWTLTTYPNVMGHIVSCFDTGFPFNNAIASMFSFEIPVLAQNICFRFAYVLWITISQITQLIWVMCWLHRDIATTTRLLRSIALNLMNLVHKYNICARRERSLCRFVQSSTPVALSWYNWHAG